MPEALLARSGQERRERIPNLNSALNSHLRVFLLAGLCAAGVPAHAGLFSDDEARLQIQQVGTRVSGLEDAAKKQDEINSQQSETGKQQTRIMLDLQSQIETMNTELRGLRGQNEELVHKLQDAENRQKDFYIDLDTRVRHFESIESAAVAQSAVASSVPQTGDPAAGNAEFDSAQSLFKSGKHQDAIDAFQAFLKKYPDSAKASNAYYAMATAYFVLNDFQHAQDNYQALINKYASSAKVPEAMLGIADCEKERKDVAAAKKTLKQLITKFPGSESAIEAKKRLTTLK